MPRDDARELQADPAPITGLVVMIHVADVDRSIGFYRLLGFEVGNRVPSSGPAEWAWLYAPKAPDWRRGANLMLARSARAIQRERQDALFYLYATDLTALRSELLSKGVAASEISYPDYLPEGELGVIDPDGWCLMIAQSTRETP